MPGALSRFRMLDLSRQLPGPFCSMLLADLGMDVLAVYSPTDPMGMGIPLLGRNKRSLTLNLKAPEGRAIFHRLAREADVVLEGSRPGAAARLGVDYETLRALNPRLVYCSISGYGQDGPYRDRVGHDVNYLGFAGVIGLTGPAGGPPVIPGVQIADIGGGTLMAAVGILAGPAATLGEARAGPQVRHRGMVVELDGGRRTLGNPIKLSDTPPTIRTPPPELGEHTDAVLAALGYSRADIAGLRARGVV